MQKSLNHRDELGVVVTAVGVSLHSSAELAYVALVSGNVSRKQV